MLIDATMVCFRDNGKSYIYICFRDAVEIYNESGIYISKSLYNKLAFQNSIKKICDFHELQKHSIEYNYVSKKWIAAGRNTYIESCTPVRISTCYRKKWKNIEELIHQKAKSKSNGKWLLNVNYKHTDIEDVHFEISHESYKPSEEPEKFETVTYGTHEKKWKKKSKRHFDMESAKRDIINARKSVVCNSNVYNSHSNANNKPEEENGVKVRGIKAGKR